MLEMCTEEEIKAYHRKESEEIYQKYGILVEDSWYGNPWVVLVVSIIIFIMILGIICIKGAA